jgi:peptide/nickel transport system ATP-binding protein
MHPYTEALMWSALALEGLRPRALDLARKPPDRAHAQDSETGCPYRLRCPRYLGAQCDVRVPDVQEVAPGHRIACHIPVGRLRDLQAAEWAHRSMEEDVHGR